MIRRQVFPVPLAKMGSTLFVGQTLVPDSLTPSQILNAPIHTILATDCGSTTTKAILIELQPDGEYRRVHAAGEPARNVQAELLEKLCGACSDIAH